jgi:hypothetical protein
MAWKVMLPLGMVNLVAVAVLIEFGWDTAQRRLGINPLVAMGAMWGVAIVAWLVAGSLAPLATDNRPRLSNDEL